MLSKAAVTTTFTIGGMHCSSCAMNIDFELEDLAGITEAKTYEPDKITPQQITAAIIKLGYQANI
jgi:copper chaperone CopZ